MCAKELKRTSLFFFCLQSFPVMVGDIDNTGSLNAQIIHQLTSAVRSKIALQVTWLHTSRIARDDCASFCAIYFFIFFKDPAAQVCQLAV